MSGHIFFISGPSGVGKGTVIDHLRATRPDYLFPPSCTTRAPRPGEIDGETYYFLSDAEFDQKIDAGEFLEWATVHKKARYGTLKEKLVIPAQSGATVIREFDVQGFLAAKEALPRALFTGIFIQPDNNRMALMERIRERSPMTESEMQRRMESLEKELQQAVQYDHVVTSHHGEQVQLITDVERIIAGL